MRLLERWERLRAKGTWDEARVKECRKAGEANSKGETVHLGRIFEACYEKGSELEAWNPLRKFKGRTVFEGYRDQNSDHALLGELGSSPASMEAAKILDAYGSQPGFGKQQADAVQACRPSSLVHGYLFRAIGGRKPGRANSKTQ